MNRCGVDLAEIDFGGSRRRARRQQQSLSQSTQQPAVQRQFDPPPSEVKPSVGTAAGGRRDCTGAAAPAGRRADVRRGRALVRGPAVGGCAGRAARSTSQG